MNKQSLSALVVLNVVLLVALLVVTLSPPPAQAQLGGRGDYVMIAGQVVGLQDRALIYLLELKTLRLAAVTFDTRNNRLDIIAGKELAPDMQDAAGGARLQR